MMKVKREGSGTLCDTCKRSTIMRGPGGEQTIYCRMIERAVPHPVMDCTGYNDRRHPWPYEMEQLAWLLITEAKHGQKVGFYSPSERRKRNIEEPEIPTTVGF